MRAIAIPALFWPTVASSGVGTKLGTVISLFGAPLFRVKLGITFVSTEDLKSRQATSQHSAQKLAFAKNADVYAALA